MDNRIQVALIGCGGMGTKLGQSLGELGTARIAVCCDIDEARLSAASEAFSPDRALTDYHEALDNPAVDAVIIATPNYLHASMAVDAAHAGKHIFTEKPMALCVADCDAMIAAARQAGVKLMVGQVLRYIGNFAKAKQIIDSGELGKPFAIEVDRINNSPGRGDWRTSKAKTGGMLPEVNVHELDFMAYVLGEPVSVYAQSGHFGANAYDFDDELFAIVRFEGGGIGSLHASFCAKIGRYHTKILCENGAIFFGHAPGEAIIQRASGEPETLDSSDVPDPHQRELGEFLDAIRTGAEPKIPGEQGRRAIGMCEGADISAGTGQVVRLPL